MEGLKTNTFKVTETHGGLPYIVMWIGAARIPSVMAFSTLEEAQNHVEHLASLKIKPALLLDIAQSTQSHD